MAGIWQDKKYIEKRNRGNDRGWRTSRKSGRRGCLGGPKDPYPKTYHPDNCKGERLNQGY